MATSKRKPTPARSTGPPTVVGDTPLRHAVANRSRGIMLVLSRQPQFLIPAVMLVLMVTGLAAPLVVGLPALILVVLFLGWLAYLSWPVIPAGQRAIRVAMIAVVVVAAVGRVAGWF